MAHDPIRRTWRIPIPLPPEPAWRALSDTARFNESLDMPKYQVTETPRANGSVLTVGEISRGPVHIAWEEQPVDWIAPQGFHQVRRFLNGPLAEMVVDLEIVPAADGRSSIASYTVSITPRNRLGRWLVAPAMLRGFGRKAPLRVQLAGERLAVGEARAFLTPPRRLDPATAARAAALAARIEASPYGHGAARQLLDHILSVSDIDVATLRPLAFARLAGLRPRDAIELFFGAAHFGLLDLQWDIVCPRCRGAKARPGHLQALPRQVHCPSCNVDFAANFSENVEVTFHPAAWLRPIEAGEYCLMGPGSTPHVLAQQHLAPGETRSIAVDLAPGRYGLRTREPGPETVFDHRGEQMSAVTLEGGNIMAEVSIGPGRLVLANRGKDAVTIVIERRAWRDDALTAKAATALHVFRVFFPDETLSVGADAPIDRLSFMFTDLRGSTALYERVGDAEAYRIVRRHFDFLEQVVAANSGCIVKTIGDAVLAVFAAPEDAMRTALAVRHDVAAFNEQIAPNAIRIRIGLHAGSCVAVTLNGRLDYFGSTINLAARLEHESRGDDIVLSAVLAEDWAVAALLAGRIAVREETRLRGFDRPVALVRVSGDA